MKRWIATVTASALTLFAFGSLAMAGPRKPR